MMFDIAQWGGAAAGITAIGALVTMIVNFITRDVKRDISDIRHRLENERTRIDSLDHQRERHTDRITKVENAVENIEKSQNRMETTVEKNHTEVMALIRTFMSEVSASIREARDAKFKG